MELSLFYGISPHVTLVQIQSLPTFSEFIDPDNVFTYVQSGTAEMMMLGRKYSLCPGDIIIIPPLTPHVVKKTSSTVFYVFTFDLFYNEKKSLVPRADRTLSLDDVDKHELAFLQDNDVIRLNPQEKEWFEKHFIEMHAYFFDKKTDRSFLLKAIVIEMLNMYFNGKKQKTFNYFATFTWKTIEKTMTYIWNNYKNCQLTNKDIAKSIEISPNYITSLFSQYIGVPIHKYINGLRISQACNLIIEGNLNFTEIAEEVGFYSLQNFSKVFKREMGISASEYKSHIASRIS